MGQQDGLVCESVGLGVSMLFVIEKRRAAYLKNKDCKSTCHLPCSFPHRPSFLVEFNEVRLDRKQFRSSMSPVSSYFDFRLRSGRLRLCSFAPCYPHRSILDSSQRYNPADHKCL